jgi:hypothetical protein
MTFALSRAALTWVEKLFTLMVDGMFEESSLGGRLVING